MAPITHSQSPMQPLSIDGELNAQAAADARRRKWRRLVIAVVVAILLVAAAIVGFIIWHAASTDSPPAFDFSPLTTLAP
jgi:flagellar basal body-associated protein FliL